MSRDKWTDHTKGATSFAAVLDRPGIDTFPWGGGQLPATQFGYAKFYSRSHDTVIRMFDLAGNVIDTQTQTGDFCEP
jgi:hypothetical protein